MRIILLLILLMSGASSYAQIYNETFTGQNGVGIVGPCTTDPESCESDSIPSPTGWTINGDASNMPANTDWFLVVLEKLEARDLGAELCFESKLIDVTAFDSVDISMDVSEVGDHEISDYVDVFIVVDNDSTFIPGWIGSDSTHTIVGDFPDDGDWGDTTITYNGILGDTLRFVICVRNNSGTEIIRLDNIRVENGDTLGGPLAPVVIINELDCDQPGPDTLEFIELSGAPNQSLDSFVLVLFNGNGDASYAAYDLDGYAIDNEGYFSICFGPNASEYCSLNVNGSLQNGTDGVGLYYGLNDSDFPNGTIVQSDRLVDGLRYSTGLDGIDDGLSILDTDDDCNFNECQIDENALSAQATHSIQRGSWFVGPPTPGFANESPLPVELISFDLRLHNDIVYLMWQTGWEVHNAYFAIEHSTDGRNFNEIGVKDGAHSSRALLRYYFEHNVRLVGPHYYRLRQVDEDGDFDYSPIRVVTLNNARISVTPSITSDYIGIVSSGDDEVDIGVFSCTGALMLSLKNVTSGYQKVSLQDMPCGLYVVVVESETRHEAFKIVRY